MAEDAAESGSRKGPHKIDKPVGEGNADRLFLLVQILTSWGQGECSGGHPVRPNCVGRPSERCPKNVDWTSHGADCGWRHSGIDRRMGVDAIDEEFAVWREPD